MKFMKEYKKAIFIRKFKYRLFTEIKIKAYCIRVFDKNSQMFL